MLLLQMSPWLQTALMAYQIRWTTSMPPRRGFFSSCRCWNSRLLARLFFFLSCQGIMLGDSLNSHLPPMLCLLMVQVLAFLSCHLKVLRTPDPTKLFANIQEASNVALSEFHKSFVALAAEVDLCEQKSEVVGEDLDDHLKCSSLVTKGLPALLPYSSFPASSWERVCGKSKWLWVLLELRWNILFP